MGYGFFMNYSSFSEAQKRAYRDHLVVWVGISVAYAALLIYSASELADVLPTSASAFAVLGIYFATMIKWLETVAEVLEVVEIMSKTKG